MRTKFRIVKAPEGHKDSHIMLATITVTPMDGGPFRDLPSLVVESGTKERLREIRAKTGHMRVTMPDPWLN